MNRLQPRVAKRTERIGTAPGDAAGGAGLLAVLEGRDAVRSLNVATFRPVHYEAGYAYPLVVWLHGAGQSERDLSQVMRHVSLRNYVAVAPRAPHDPQPTAARGTIWFDATWDVSEAERLVDDAVTIARSRFNIHAGRVFLAGVGAGGTAALHLALLDPGRFAGAASFDGPLPRGGRPLRCINRFRGMPLMLASSRKSRYYGEAAVCRDLRLLHAAGATLDVRQYPGDSELTTGMLRDFDAWAMRLVCGAAAPRE